MNNTVIERIRKVLDETYGKDRYDLVSRDSDGYKEYEKYYSRTHSDYLAVIHFPEITIRSRVGSIIIHDFWVKFGISEQGHIWNSRVLIARTTYGNNEVIAHPHSNSTMDEEFFASCCQGDSTQPINKAITEMYETGFNEETFKAFLYNLKVFLEYDNYDNFIADVLGGTKVDLKLKKIKPSKEFMSTMWKNMDIEALLKGTNISGSGIVTFTKAGFSEITKALDGKYLCQKVNTEEDGEKLIEVSNNKSIVEETKRVIFKFKGKNVYYKKVKNYEQKSAKFPHPEILRRIRRDIIRKAWSKTTEEGDSSGDITKTPKSNISLVQASA